MTLPFKVKAVLEELLPSLGLSSVTRTVRLRAVWPDIAGPTLSGKTAPDRIRNDVLTVTVPNHAWAQELQLGKTALIERINGVLADGPIRDIRFLVASLPERKPSPLPKVPESPSAGAYPEPEGIMALRDPETREILRSLSRKAAARKTPKA
jgi:hypothetical protein